MTTFGSSHFTEAPRGKTRRTFAFCTNDSRWSATEKNPVLNLDDKQVLKEFAKKKGWILLSLKAYRIYQSLINKIISEEDRTFVLQMCRLLSIKIGKFLRMQDFPRVPWSIIINALSTRMNHAYVSQVPLKLPRS